MRLNPFRKAEQRDAFSDHSRIPTWPEVSSWGSSYTPVPVTRDTALGLPAVGRAVTLIAQTVANLPLLVYEGRGAEKRLRDDSWQYRLLNELPGMGDFSPFDFVCDVAACLETSGNAFVLKAKSRAEVIGLTVIDPQRVEIKREAGEKLFAIYNDEGQKKIYGAGEILHIRGFTINGADVGLSPIALHRQRIGAVSAAEQYVGRFYGQGVGKKVAISVPGNPSPDAARRMLETFKANHMGLANAHVPALLTGGAEIADMGMTLEDAQFAESEKLNLIQVAHIFGLPPKFLTGEGDLNEWDFIALNQVAIAPRLRRMTSAFHSDADLFPDRKLYPEFSVRELARTDAKTMAEVEHMQIQDGTLLKDEARAERGQPPLAMPDDPEANPGMVPLLTPTGAAPNPPVKTDAFPT